MRLTDSCLLPRAEGNCGEKQSRWYFDQSENRCMPFYYTGCGGNKNNFESRDACESDCPTKIGKTSSNHIHLIFIIFLKHTTISSLFCLNFRFF